MTLPKFNFANSEIKSTADLQKAKDAEGSTGKHFRPGIYELKGVKVEYQGPAKDKTWHKYLFTWEGAGGKVATDQIMVPTSKVTFTVAKGSGKSEESLFMFNKLTAFVESVFGVVLVIETLADSLTQVFGNIEKQFVGKTVSATIGYKGNYLKYDGANEDGSKRIVIQLTDGNCITENGVVKAFPDFEAAKNYCTAQKPPINVSEYTEIRSYAKSGSSQPLKSVSNW